MVERQRSSGLTELEQKIMEIGLEGPIKTNWQIALLVGNEGEINRVKVLRSYIQRRKGITIPVRHPRPTRDLIIYHALRGLETIADIEKAADLTPGTAKVHLYHLRREGIFIPLRRSKRERTDLQ